jgi:endonuclease/exonuclease/phosphatase family metal-dependent hydrolase
VTGNLRVLTWNVWWRFGPSWRQRQAGLLKCLQGANADIVALQECWGERTTSQAHEFAERLGLYAAFVAPGLPPPPDPPETPDQAEVEVGIGLLSRWPIDQVQPVEMPSRHRTPAPVALAATVAHPAGRLHVIAACLEWEPSFNDDRLAQATALAELASDPATDGPLPVIVCGDLNAAPDSPVLRPLHQTLHDTWTLGGGAADAVTLRSDHPQAPLEVTELINQRIDHIFVRPGHPGLAINVSHVALLGDAVDGLDPSDHMAVCCDLVVAPTD